MPRDFRAGSSVEVSASFSERSATAKYQCGEEILTIAAMVSVQDVFIIPDGAQGALVELERRKFTAEEGVSKLPFAICLINTEVLF